MGGQLLASGDAGVAQLLGKGDGLAVLIQTHEHGHVSLRASHAQLGAVHHPVQHVGGVQFAGVELVAHPGPRRFLARDDIQPVFTAETLGGGHHHRSAVSERDKADLQVGLLWRIRAGGPGTAAQKTGGGEAKAGDAGNRNGLFEKVATVAVQRNIRISLAHGCGSFTPGNKKRRARRFLQRGRSDERRCS